MREVYGMDKKLRITMIGSCSIIVLILVFLGIAIKNKYTPSNEVMLLTDYYQIKDSEILIILQDKIYEKKGLLVDGEIYIDYETVVNEFNHRFYWDKNENVLTFTTPNEILQANAGSRQFTTTKSIVKTTANAEYEIVKVFADRVYLALDFVKKYSDITFQYYKNPNRVVIQYQWGDYLYTEVVKETQLRKEPSIKSPVLTQLPVEASLIYVDKEEAPKKGFSKVMTEEGVVGYVRNKHLKQSFYKTLTSSYVEPEYTAQTRPGKINLVFHQVFNAEAAGNLEELINSTKGVTVVSPTWFKVVDNNGTIESLANQKYVDKAKNLGLEVWALIDDFSAEVSMFEVLSYTSRRENLANTLIDYATQYKLNGINIDFEKISRDAGVHYVQFLRELSVKCRNNGIVLSVDNYVPAPYNQHYGREEQGKIVDYIVVMAYDEHFGGSETAGPVASIGYVMDAIRNTLAVVPKEKTIIAIPFYTRLWKETDEGDVTSQSLAMTPASNVLKDNGVETVWDENRGYYYGEYVKDGATYKMWQEEERSLEEKLKAIYEADVAGIAAWKLGLEKESVWNVIIRYLN